MLTPTHFPRHGQFGFTLVELIVTMIIIGIMAVSVLPRFSGLSDFDAKGFHDQTVAQLRFAQKTALAQRRTVCVTVGSTGITLRIASSDTVAVCTTGSALTPPFTPKAGSGLGGGNFNFLRMGETDGAGAVSGTITLTITGADNILIDATTGYVR
ncbi:MAG: prepilin-type N-terminal cleavage/methylation domain-containing protein [Sulfuritalea sp.]|nr:prepilin-type N-terminal cleavage/methylation domain-containing protein [Sulfuritalea sp.]